jgi:hypothetical protein
VMSLAGAVSNLNLRGYTVLSRRPRSVIESTQSIAISVAKMTPRAWRSALCPHRMVRSCCSSTIL